MVSRAVNETTVLYKAIADFSDLKKKSAAAKKDVNDLTKAYQNLNKEASKKLPESQASTTKINQQKRAIQELSQSHRSLTTAVNSSTTAMRSQRTSLSTAKYTTQSKAVNSLADAYDNLSKKARSSNTALGNQNKHIDASSDRLNDYVDYIKLAREEQEVFGAATDESNGFQKAFKKAVQETNTTLTTHNRSLNTASNRVDDYSRKTKRAQDASVEFQRATDESSISLGMIHDVARDATNRLKDYSKTLTPLSKKTVSSVTFKETYSTSGRGGGKRTPEFAPSSGTTAKVYAYAKSVAGAAEAEERHRRALLSVFPQFQKVEKEQKRSAASALIHSKALDNLRGSLKKLAQVRISFNPTLPFFTAIMAIVGSAIPSLIAGIGALGAALFGLGSNLASVAGNALLAFPAIAALTGVVAALALGFNGMGDALKAGLDGDVEKFDEALAKLSPSAQAVTRSLVGQADAWREVRSAVQESLFAPVADDMDKLVTLAPTVQKFLTGIAGALGRVASRGIDMVTSTRWMSNMDSLGRNLVPVVESLGDGLLYLTDMFLTISEVAAPVLRDMTEGFSNWAQGMAEITQAGQESGGLATYIQKVYERLQQWGRIVGNIADTLYNYGAAAEPFGQWMTDGLEALTEGWKTASETARTEGSAFQTYLENIKPLLSEVGGLVGDFFGWFARVSMDPQNIENFTSLVKLIRDELGPNLADLLDTLAETEIDKSIVEAVSSIVGLVDSLLANGGADVLKGAATAIADIAGFLEDVSEIPGAAPIMTGMIGLISAAMIAAPAVSAISTIAGAMKSISNLVFPKGFSGFIDKLKGVKASGGVGALGGIAAGAGGAILAGQAYGNYIEEGTQNTTTPGGDLLKGASQIMKLDVVGGTETINQAIEDLKEGFKNGDFTIDDIFADLKGAFPWASWIFDLQLEIIKWGEAIETWWDGIVEGVTTWGEDFAAGFEGMVGDIQTAVSEWEIWDFIEDPGAWLQEKSDAFVSWVVNDLPAALNQGAEDLWNNLGDFATWLGDQWIAAQTWFSELPGKIAVLALDIWANIKSFGAWLGEQWDAAIFWFQNLPASIALIASDIWANLKSFWTWLGEKWEEAKQFFIDLPMNIATAVVDLWGDLKSFLAWLDEKWTEAKTWWTDLGSKVSEAAGDFWQNLIGPGTFLGNKLTEFKNWAAGIGAAIKNAAGDFWNELVGPGSWLDKMWFQVQIWARRIPGMVASAIGNIFRFVSGFFSMNFNVGGAVRQQNASVSSGGGRAPSNGRQRYANNGGAIQKRNRGGVLHRANGGGRDTSSVVPGTGNVDKVPAMLTPGEFVVRKAITSRIGIDNLAKLNSGVISYGDLLRQLLADKAVNSGSKAGLGFLNGGGMVPSFDPVGSTISNSVRNSSNSYSTSTRGPSTVIEQLIIQNPVPETASDSLPKTLRRQGYTK